MILQLFLDFLIVLVLISTSKIGKILNISMYNKYLHETPVKYNQHWHNFLYHKYEYDHNRDSQRVIT